MNGKPQLFTKLISCMVFALGVFSASGVGQQPQPPQQQAFPDLLGALKNYSRMPWG